MIMVEAIVICRADGGAAPVTPQESLVFKMFMRTLSSYAYDVGNIVT